MMTSEMSEIDALKTNEFIRRRKLRLQQVREQSKDIAKKIRQRAKVEKLKQVVELDAKKHKEYFQRQTQLVKQLEQLYAKGIENVGASHKSASELKLPNNHTEKVDPSKQRGKEAAAELRKKRQEKLDEQKKLLDRKLQAREAANEACREKSVTVVNKLFTKAKESQTKESVPDTSNKDGNEGGESSEVKHNDMATQWDLEPSEWEPNVPKLSLPKDQDSVKETNNNESKSDKSKRLDLFALSEEMPLSLRGGLTAHEERAPVKPSLTLVSEFLQNRGLRLREPNPPTSTKNMEELQSLKQTIFRTRASKEVSGKGSTDKISKLSALNSAVPKKSSVTMYNHSTRNVRDIPCQDERLVVRDSQIEDDAYSQAMKETATDYNGEKDDQKKVQEIRSKVAVTKQNVEKEYKDTISFLNSLPKDMGNKPIKSAYMDEHRQQSLKDGRQQKLQQEYKKIMKDCKKHNCRNKTGNESKSRSTDFDSTDFQYSWMPVPEGDGNLAIHAIPTSLKEGKSGNTVKFSKVDSYHEYRSRHKHTPPTKDTNQPKRFTEAVLIQNSSDSESVSSESSSTENISLEKNDKTSKDTRRLSDAERIIIYKILDSKNSKIMREIAKSLTLIDKENTAGGHTKKCKSKKISSDSEKRMSFEELNEGVYKAVNENGDNIASMYFDKDGDKIELTKEEIKSGRPCCCSKKLSKDQQHERGTSLQWESGDNPLPVAGPSSSCVGCKCGCGSKLSQPRSINEPKDYTDHSAKLPSATTSTSSFKTASNDKASNALPDGGYIKLIDEGGEEAGKFYIGASGFLKDDAYEVVIQLRKKGDDKEREQELPKINEEDPVSKVSVSVETVEPTPRLDPIEVNNNDKGLRDSPKDLNKSKNKSVVNIASEVQIDSNVRHSSSEANQDANEHPKIAKDVSEKGVCTSFQDTYAVPSHVPISDSNPRPATSTYTQTSMSSPNHRPVFFHMSSSTSTAYMSPPEMILPKFLRQDHRMSDDDLYDPRNYEMHDKIEVTDEHEYCEDYECRCRKCRHARKIVISRTNAAHKCRKAKHGSGKTEAPPDTVRNEDELDDVSDSKNGQICRCRKCVSRDRLTKPSSTSIHMKNKPIITATKRSSRNLMVRATSSSASTNKDKHKQNKSSMNPVIREYVNKLLALNKESLKAIQVVDQDCSSVATPGSSIINVPNNNDDKKPLENKISLEQIKNILKQQIIDECEQKIEHNNHKNDVCLKNHSNHNAKLHKTPRRKQVHKVKSLNISKNLVRTMKTGMEHPQLQQTSSSSAKEDNLKINSLPSRNKIRSKSSPTPRSTPAPTAAVIRSKTSTNVTTSATKPNKHQDYPKFDDHKATFGFVPRLPSDRSEHSCKRAAITSTSPNSETRSGRAPHLQRNRNETPSNMSTQTSINVDSEINFIKYDQDKIQNMEKIADLTEKCTKRLSNLAKVLEEVRKNKSLAYSQISTSDAASDSDQKSNKNANKQPGNAYQSLHDTQKSLESKSPDIFDAVEELNENENNLDSEHYIPFLTDIPKPDSFKTPNLELNFNSFSSSKSNHSSPTNENYEQNLKSRGKPPPALSRIHLKNVQDCVIPHELSTVVEVDSPMSVKLKSQTSRNDTRLDVPDSFNRIDNATYKADQTNTHRNTVNPDLLDSNVDIPARTKIITAESSDDSKIQMIDMNHFNEIMLKPFFSLQEYAKQHNVGALDDGSNLEEFIKGDIVHDELSSLHSDGSLPDVISELLKRNIISEPFKFDTGSTTISSESTLSVLALSKVRKEKKKSSVMFQNKENIGETSDTLSVSSNPDLENAFKRLGMGWASSTLKKTKERLALSSSSNTSSSSLSQFKIKSFNQDIPTLVTDTVSSVLNSATKKPQQGNAADTSKNAEQQTSLTNSMTVKEFLNNELAKKITFNNKSRNDTEEFVSLFETKMPEDMKHASRTVRDDSVETSIRSGNRARTSTPVQLFKSITYQSSSSSNVSNGLFSNADDLSSVKGNSNSIKHSTSDKDDLTIPNFSLRIKKDSSDCSKSD